MKTIRIVAVAVLIVARAVARHVVQAQQAGARRTELQRHDLSVPGREVIQVRVDLEPGYTFPRHTHPGEEIIYVIEGTWEYEIGGKLMTATRPSSPPISSRKDSRSLHLSSDCQRTAPRLEDMQ